MLPYQNSSCKKNLTKDGEIARPNPSQLFPSVLNSTSRNQLPEVPPLSLQAPFRTAYGFLATFLGSALAFCCPWETPLHEASRRVLYRALTSDKGHTSSLTIQGKGATNHVETKNQLGNLITKAN